VPPLCVLMSRGAGYSPHRGTDRTSDRTECSSSEKANFGTNSFEVLIASCQRLDPEKPRVRIEFPVANLDVSIGPNPRGDIMHGGQQSLGQADWSSAGPRGGYVYQKAITVTHMERELRWNA